MEIQSNNNVFGGYGRAPPEILENVSSKILNGAFWAIPEQYWGNFCCPHLWGMLVQGPVKWASKMEIWSTYNTFFLGGGLGVLPQNFFENLPSKWCIPSHSWAILGHFCCPDLWGMLVQGGTWSKIWFPSDFPSGIWGYGVKCRREPPNRASEINRSKMKLEIHPSFPLCAICLMKMKYSSDIIQAFDI